MYPTGKDPFVDMIDREHRRTARAERRFAARQRIATNEAIREAERLRAIREANLAFAAMFVRWATRADIPRDIIDTGDRPKGDKPEQVDVQGWVIKRRGLEAEDRENIYDAITADGRIVRVYYGGLTDIKLSRIKRVVAKFVEQHSHLEPWG